jgi:aminoglycoside phosphotransferase (APT) family kinase protein
VTTTVEPTAELTRALADLRRRLAETSGGEVDVVGSLEPFGDGHSGFTYATEIEVRGARRRAVLRLSPRGARIAGPADIGRQGAIMAALAGSGVPVPEVFDHSSEPLIDRRAFMLVELVEGQGAAAAAAEIGDAAVAGAAVSVLRALHAVAPAGEDELSDTAEIERWTALLPRCPDPVRIGAERLVDALRSRPPAPTPPRRVHGDFHYGNLLFRGGRVVAVVDWEVSSVGSPYCDLGSLVVASIRRRYAPEPNSMIDLAVAPAEVASLYGGDPGQAAWHAASACLKYAAIIGYNYELHRSGRRPDREYELLGETMRGLPEDGLALLEQGLEARR